MAGGTDSAGVPWEGRAFHDNPNADDDGVADPRLVDAIGRFRAGRASLPEVVEAVREARLLVPLVAERGEEGIGAHGQTVDKTQELALVTVAAPDGRGVLPAFSSVEAMAAWDPAARPIPVSAARAALAAEADGLAAIVLDPGSGTELALRRTAFEAIATGSAYTPCFADDRVLAAFLAAAEGERPVRAVQLAPGDPQARLTGPELLVQLTLEPGLDAAALDALLGRLGAAWAQSEVIGACVDSIAVRLESL